MSVISLYKQRGETPLECVERFIQSNSSYKDVSVTYAGRLDPMAEGLLIILTGEDVYKKDEFTKLPKVYEFEVLWGFETDTYDALGLITYITSVELPKGVSGAVSSFVGKYTQEYPPYSSKTVLGKPLFMWAREGALNTINIPTKEIEIFKLEHTQDVNIQGGLLKEDIVNSLKKVKGDFRQVEIIKQWESVLIENINYSISSLKVSCSSGTYIRSLVQRIAKKLQTHALALRIKRFSIGDFNIKDSQTVFK